MKLQLTMFTTRFFWKQKHKSKYNFKTVLIIIIIKTKEKLIVMTYCAIFSLWNILLWLKYQNIWLNKCANSDDKWKSKIELQCFCESFGFTIWAAGVQKRKYKIATNKRTCFEWYWNYQLEMSKHLIEYSEMLDVHTFMVFSQSNQPKLIIYRDTYFKQKSCDRS